MKKRLLISGLMLLLVVIAIVFYTSKRGVADNKEKINIPLPTITGAINVRADFSFNLPQDFEVPDTASLITQESSAAWTIDEVGQMATNLGLTSEPLTFNDTLLGKTYLYTEGSLSLTVYPTAKIVRFSQQIQQPKNKNLKSEDYINAAESFVNKISLKNTYKLAFINYLSTSYTSERYSFSSQENFNTVRINLSPIRDSVKIVTKSPEASLATVILDKNGDITKAEIRDLDKITFSDQKYKLKNIDEIKKATNDFILVSLDNGYYPDLNQIKGSITNVNITSIEFVYLYDYEKKDYIQPVFLLKGIAKMKGVENEVNVSFFYPAFAR